MSNASVVQIKEWIDRLTSEEFLKVLSFHFKVEISVDDTSSLQHNDDLNTSGSHEFSLLREMLATQSPPPTPIHPRALWFRPASESGFSNGRRDEESRVQRNRFERPRLFQFIERYDNSQDEVEIHFDLTQLPPEIAAMVRKENGIDTVALGNTRRGKSEKKVRSTKNNTTNRKKSSKLYDVLAKKFVTAWGEVLTIGSTEMQRRADEDMLRCSRIHYGCRKSNRNISNNTDHAGPMCTFQLAFDRRRKISNMKRDVLNILRIASRGKFLSMSPSKAHAHIQLDFCAPWFDPISEWFSLPMYLASRFEAALWDSYLRKDKAITCDIPRTVIEEISMNLPKHIFIRCLFGSVSQSLRASIFSEVAPSGKNRDLILNQLLHPQQLSHAMNIFNPLTKNGNYDIISITSSSLIKLGTTSDNFRLDVVKYLEDTLSRETERELLKSLQAETYCGSNEMDTTNHKSKKKSKKKKNRKKVSTSCTLSAIDEVKSAAVLTQCEKACFPLSSALPSPTSLTSYPSNESNQKNIMALAIFDEIVNSVCDKLGISSSKDSDDGWMSYDNTNKGNETAIKQRILKPLSSRQKLSNSDSQQDTGGTKLIPGENKYPELWNEQKNLSVNQLTVKRNNLTRIPGPTTWHDTVSHPLGLSEFDVISSFQFGEPINMSKWHQYQGIKSSILSDFLINQKHNFDTDDDNFASSAAASIASSVLDSGEDLDQIQLMNSGNNSVVNTQPSGNYASTVDYERKQHENTGIDCTQTNKDETKTTSCKECVSPMVLGDSFPAHLEPTEKKSTILAPLKIQLAPMKGQSPTLEPIAPTSQPSPIAVTLGDLNEIHRQKSSEISNTKIGCAESPKNNSLPVHCTGSLPSSPQTMQEQMLTTSWSREDLRIPSLKDDQIARGRVRSGASSTVDSSLSYRNAAMKNVRKPPSVSSYGAIELSAMQKKLQNVRKPPSVSSYDAFDLSTTQKKLTESARFVRSGSNSKEVIIDGYIHLNTCAQSESALDAHEDSSHWNVVPKTGFYETDNATTTKDGATTISSFPPEIEELASLREERNAFRDMCLTLGGEIAKLQNILAMEQGASKCLNTTHAETSLNYDAPFFQSRNGSFRKKFVAFSDVGAHHEIQPSEDGTDAMQGSIAATDASGKPRSNIGNASNTRLSPMVEKRTGSDVPSIEHRTVTYSTLNNCSRPNHRESVGPKDLHDLQSRLTKDINSFLSSVASRLKEQDSRRTLVIKRLRLLVNTIWPRAQIKMYGSHYTNLCLPSSDFDIVVCLPAVHKNTLADTPGALEGRNAVNESNQKLLARKLKSESWIDPRSMKVIERTAFPLIKVSTKDKSTRSLQLDITFDSPQHHGLEGVEMVTAMIEDYPLLRPLVLVLKQFLLGKGLLTSYTGGLSSYCLFLMVTRYLQAQTISPWIDSGSLLMGFLDFYGNAFEPRSTGISVLRRQYFSRHRYDSQPAAVSEHEMFSPSPQDNLPTESNFISLSRRHSFQEVPHSISTGQYPQATKAPLICQPNPQHFVLPQASPPVTSALYTQDIPGRPTYYDPLFVEDPLTPANNVGRNCFRFPQVKRAFSDAHRALVASLEWDMNSAVDFHDAAYYPLLRCVLQSENMSWDL